jgi:hypothetical protein
MVLFGASEETQVKNRSPTYGWWVMSVVPL